MAISLCSALVLVTLSQAPPVAPTDSLATLRGRAAQDSSDAQLWLLMGRAYLGLGVEAHGATHRSSEDSVWTRAVLDTAEEALGRAAALAGPLGSSAVGDSARVFRVGAWAATSGVCEHGVRTATGDAAAHQVGDAAARVGGRRREEPAGPPARLRVRGAAPGARQQRPVGRARARGLHPGRARHSHAVRCDGDVQGGRRRADVPEIMSPTIKRVLVANRGEIALRIIRACHEEGLEAVAVYSEVDRLSPHVRAADLAVSLGPPAAAQSYLDIPKLISAAQGAGCQAVHPGYGFLSERAPFAEAVAAASLEFIGPPAAAIRAMGDKTEARRRMQQAGVPIVPGSTRPLADHVQARAEAARLGFPVLLKAAAGGGGKGMRLVREEAELEAGFEAASSEARKAFGADEIYLEKYLERPRHIEIQILADSFGRVVSLGERECSIQRRHQKLIEEAPSVAVTPPLRRRMSESAASAAGAVGYLGAGTIEFLLAPSGEFYFLEMNTRLHVEHPVTELVYGVDIVREQLRVAMGQPLRVHAGTLQPRGHAIECRITAEDPVNDFLPATGVVRYLRVPGGPGVRWDGGIEEGNEVTLHYDPLIAKLIVWGETRAVALERMRRALRELTIVGIPSSQAFHLRVMDDPEFQRGDLDVTYLERAGARLRVGEVPAELTRQ